MNFRPPTETAYTVQRGDEGIAAWAVQRARNEIVQSSMLVEDGVYGPATVRAVKTLQEREGLGVDGKFGPETSRRAAKLLEGLVVFGGPDGLIRGLVEAESGGLIAAVNTMVAGGTDCGYTQRRVLTADYDNPDVVKRAFDGYYQMALLANRLQGRHDAFFGQTGARTHLKAWRLATLDHNYPSLAQKIAQVGVGGLSSYYTTPQSWVEAIGAKFPDGAPIRTPLEWAQHYALAAPAHNEPGTTWRFVVV